jgi:hypothetical protein
VFFCVRCGAGIASPQAPCGACGHHVPAARAAASPPAIVSEAAIESPEEERDLRMEAHVHAIGFWYVVGALFMVTWSVAFVAARTPHDRPGVALVVVLGVLAAAMTAIGIGLRRLARAAQVGALVHAGSMLLGSLRTTFGNRPGIVLGQVAALCGAAFVGWFLLWRPCRRVFSRPYRAMVRGDPDVRPRAHTSPIFYAPWLFVLFLVVLGLLGAAAR